VGGGEKGFARQQQKIERQKRGRNLANGEEREAAIPFGTGKGHEPTMSSRSLGKRGGTIQRTSRRRKHDRRKGIVRGR